jgi:hypothetical protein
MVADSREEDYTERFTREEAIQIARAESKRDYSEQDDAIRYVAYISEVHAFCLCEFAIHKDAWIKTYRLLMPTEWLPDEAIEDETIINVAQSGHIVSAVLLYRVKYGVGLRDGLLGVQRLIGEGAAGEAIQRLIGGGPANDA